MIKSAINALNGKRNLGDILAPIQLKVDELREFAEVQRVAAIELRKQAEELQAKAAQCTNDSAYASEVADKLEGLL